MDAEWEARSSDTPYARARETPFAALAEHAILYGGSSAQWRELARVLRKLGNKQAWRRICARRTSAFAITLRRLEQVLGDRYAGRARVATETCWAVAAVDDAGNHHVVARVRATTPHTLEELSAPVVVEILHPMVDIERLRRLMDVPRGRRRRPATCGSPSTKTPAY